MFKIVISLLVLTSVCAVYDQGSSLADINLSDLKVSANCLTKATQALETCKKTAWSNWMNSDLETEMERAMIGHLDKVREIRIHLHCCEAWDTFDCVQVALKECTTEDQQVAKVHFDSAVKELEVTACNKYKYHTGECVIKNTHQEQSEKPTDSGQASISANFFKLFLAFIFFNLLLR